MSVAERVSAALHGFEGVVRPVATAPDPLLSQPGKDVDPTAPETLQLVADLLATMAVSPGCVGLAAPQVRVGSRVFVVDVTTHERTVTCHGVFALCNVTVVEGSRRRPGREGCMSVPELTGEVKRATRVVVRGQLPGEQDWITLETDAFEARALQHEIDHCAGLLFLDQVAGAHAVHPRGGYR